jgi:meiotically up-regulated gene 157 (Mug157) protein
MRARLRIAAPLIVIFLYLLWVKSPQLGYVTWDEGLGYNAPEDGKTAEDIKDNSPVVNPTGTVLPTSSTAAGNDVLASSVQDLKPTGSAGEQVTSAASHSTSSPPSHNSTNTTSNTASAKAEPTLAPCIPYERLQQQKNGPLSTGKRQFPYSRPPPHCRTFHLPSLEKVITDMKPIIKDPDLYRLFENSYPNTLDTMVKWHGYAEVEDEKGNKTTTDQELTYLITGDIDAMWLRDSASQLYSYLPLLESSSDPNFHKKESLASLWRGLINLQARQILISPYCHSFQPPPESHIPPTINGAFARNNPQPGYDPSKVFDCKWELDSLASFLQISAAYFQRTGDIAFFSKYDGQWGRAVKETVRAAGAMRKGTYDEKGKVSKSAWTFTGWTNRGSETLTNDGLGNPSRENGMVRSAFRPSDDACIFQFLVPSNMMWTKYLEEASAIVEKLEGQEAKSLMKEMRAFALGIRRAIDRDAVVRHDLFGDIYAYEIDGFGSANLMDDANIPSLLSIPYMNYTSSRFPVEEKGGDEKREHAQLYNNTRAFVLSDHNPYFMRGPPLSAIGGPHLGPGKSWPMAAIMRAMTAIQTLPSSSAERSEAPKGENEAVKKQRTAVEAEVRDQLLQVLDSTAGSGVVHESVRTWVGEEGDGGRDYTRAWFGWANGLVGELVFLLKERELGWLGGSFQ